MRRLYRLATLAAPVALAGCGFSVPAPTQPAPALAPAPTVAIRATPASAEPAPKPAQKPAPELFPLDKFLADISDGRSFQASTAPYVGREYLFPLKVTGWTSTGYAVCEFAGELSGKTSRELAIKLPPETKRGDTLSVVARLEGFEPAHYSGNFVRLDSLPSVGSFHQSETPHRRVAFPRRPVSLLAFRFLLLRLDVTRVHLPKDNRHVSVPEFFDSIREDCFAVLTGEKRSRQLNGGFVGGFVVVIFRVGGVRLDNNANPIDDDRNRPAEMRIEAVSSAAASRYRETSSAFRFFAM